MPAILHTAWSKQRPLCERLLELARILGPGHRMPTVRQLCTAFDISTSTLDIALRDLEMRGAIVREHGRGIYASATIRQKTIGVVFGGDIFLPHFSPFWGLLLQAIREQAGGCDLRPLAYLDISQGHTGLGDHTQLREDLQAQRLEGLLLLAPHHSYDEASKLRAFGVPLVVFGGKATDWNVTHDIAHFIHLAAEEMVSHGCRRVALLGHGVLEYHPCLSAALREERADIEVADWSYETWAWRIPGAGSQENLAHKLTQRMIADAAGTPLPDGLVSLDDTMTHGCITALLQAGLRPGRHLHIATSVNKGSPVLDLYAHEVSCIEFDPAQSARAALGMLSTLMDGGTPPHNPVLIAPVRKGKHR